MLRLQQERAEHIVPLEADEERRRGLGIYYTPRTAAATLAAWAIREASDTVLEPSFGGCAILEAAIDRLRLVGCADPARRIFGFDVDATAFSFLEQLKPSIAIDHFVRKDFLAVDPGQLRVRVVVANPPFVSYHRMSGEQRLAVLRWRKNYDYRLSLRASLWAYFLVHSLNFLEEGGRLAFVLPSAFLSADYAAPILETFRRTFACVTAVRVREQMFIQAGAEERAVALLAEGYCSEGVPRCTYRDQTVLTLQDMNVAIAVPAEKVRSLPGLSAQPLPPWEAIIDEALGTSSLMRVGACARLTIGEVVGDTAFFVKALDEWDKLQMPRRHLRPLVTRTRQLNGLRVSSSREGAPYGTIPWMLVTPTSRIPTVVSTYLAGYPIKQREANVTFGKRHPWHNVSYACNADGFVGSLAHGSPRIVVNTSRISCGNGLYKVLLMGKSPGIRWLSAASLSTVFRLSAEVHGRPRGGGVLKIEPSDLGKLLVPARPLSFSASQVRAIFEKLDALVKKGEREAATQLADHTLLVETRIMSAATLQILRKELQDRRNQRLVGTGK